MRAEAAAAKLLPRSQGLRRRGLRRRSNKNAAVRRPRRSRVSGG